MKAIILILGLIGLVGCSSQDSNTHESMSKIEIPDLKMELVTKYYGYMNGSPSTSNELIRFLERRYLLSRQERAWIENGSDEFKAFIKLKYKEGDLRTVSSNAEVYRFESYSYELEIVLGTRVIKINEGTKKNYSYVSKHDYGTHIHLITYVELEIDSQSHESIFIISTAVIEKNTHQHLFHTVSVSSSLDSQLLSSKYALEFPVCEFYTGNLIEEYCQ